MCLDVLNFENFTGVMISQDDYEKLLRSSSLLNYRSLEKQNEELKEQLREQGLTLNGEIGILKQENEELKNKLDKEIELFNDMNNCIEENQKEICYKQGLIYELKTEIIDLKEKLTKQADGYIDIPPNKIEPEKEYVLLLNNLTIQFTSSEEINLIKTKG